MVIGGVANLVWGEPRLTQDVDVTVALTEERVQEFIELLAQHFEILLPDPLPFFREHRVLPLASAGGARFDLIWAGLPYEEAALERSVPHSLGGVAFRVVTPEDLIVHKLVSTRPRDREDVDGVLRRQRPTLDREYLDPLVQELAEVLERPEIWDWYRSQFGV